MPAPSAQVLTAYTSQRRGRITGTAPSTTRHGPLVLHSRFSLVRAALTQPGAKQSRRPKDAGLNSWATAGSGDLSGRGARSDSPGHRHRTLPGPSAGGSGTTRWCGRRPWPRPARRRHAGSGRPGSAPQSSPPCPPHAPPAPREWRRGGDGAAAPLTPRATPRGRAGKARPARGSRRPGGFPPRPAGSDRGAGP